MKLSLLLETINERTKKNWCLLLTYDFKKKNEDILQELWFQQKHKYSGKMLSSTTNNLEQKHTYELRKLWLQSDKLVSYKKMPEHVWTDLWLNVKS